jgi:hypothetical protein
MNLAQYRKQIVIGVTVSIVVYFIFRTVKGLAGNLSNALTPPKDGSKPELDAEGYAALADLQENAMASFGTSTEKLFNTVEGLNGADLKQLFKAFGKRKYMWFGGTSYLGQNKNLFEWYIEELDDRDLNRMRAIWDKSGLKF